MYVCMPGIVQNCNHPQKHLARHPAWNVWLTLQSSSTPASCINRLVTLCGQLSRSCRDGAT